MPIAPRLLATLGKLAVGAFCAALAAGIACKPKYAANEPVDGAPDACCRVGNAEMTKFAGCRVTHRCKSDEAIWMRGHIMCSPVEEGRCAGGRCCEYRPLYGSPDAVLFWDDGSGAATEGAPPKGAEEAAPATTADPAEAAPAGSSGALEGDEGEGAPTP